MSTINKNKLSICDESELQNYHRDLFSAGLPICYAIDDSSDDIIKEYPDGQRMIVSVMADGTSVVKENIEPSKRYI